MMMTCLVTWISIFLDWYFLAYRCISNVYIYDTVQEYCFCNRMQLILTVQSSPDFTDDSDGPQIQFMPDRVESTACLMYQQADRCRGRIVKEASGCARCMLVLAIRRPVEQRLVSRGESLVDIGSMGSSSSLSWTYDMMRLRTTGNNW